MPRSHHPVAAADSKKRLDSLSCFRGASALLSCPIEGLSLQDKQQTTQTLLNCGARIQEVNAIRKHISRVKGGRLAELAYPSTVLSLILSDVIDDSMDNIGSGPTVPDSSTLPIVCRLLIAMVLEQ